MPGIEATAYRQATGLDAELTTKLHEVQPSDRSIEVERRLVEGSAADALVRLADELKCDLIVMGTHGRSGLPHVLLGSVAEKVVRKAGCPVLTVRPSDHKFVMP